MSKSAKDIIVRVIPARTANDFVRKTHYSRKVAPNSSLHFGVFLDGYLHGVMQFGPSINKKGTINLVSKTSWNGFIELNRMAFDEYLPKNSESRAISIAMKLIKKNAPQIEWVISFADATQCGSGTIYRASGFTLVSVVKNISLRTNPKTGEPIHVIQAHHLKISKEFRTWKPLVGYQIKYVFFINKDAKKRLTVKPLDYSVLDTLDFPEGVRHKVIQ